VINRTSRDKGFRGNYDIINNILNEMIQSHVNGPNFRLTHKYISIKVTTLTLEQHMLLHDMLAQTI
jgi:hypothetical protein